MPVPFRAIADLCDRLKQLSARKEITRTLADFLRDLPAPEIRPAVLLVIGRALPESGAHTLNVSGAALWEAMGRLLPAPEELYHRVFAEAEDIGVGLRRLMEQLGYQPDPTLPSLTVPDVYGAFVELAAISGPTARTRRLDLLSQILSRASPAEAEYLAKNVVREMRSGVGEGLLLEAVALAAGVAPDLVRRANMLTGDLGLVAEAALLQGKTALSRVAVEYFRPIKPMLAQVAETVGEAMETQGGACALEYKLDGARVQIHRQGQRVEIFSRRLSPLTAAFPEVVEQVLTGLACQRCILEGEVIALAPGGRPLPFQELMRRLGRVHDLARMRQEIPVSLFLFDALAEGDIPLLDLPYLERSQCLTRLAGSIPLVSRLLTSDPRQGEAFMRQATDAGHEGVMVKRLDAHYMPGQRGKAWLKVKSAITVDLAVIGADWGYGRRHGWLSNYHLAARDEDTGNLVMVGKTFKGPTDAMFREMTARLLALETHRTTSSVFVRPQVVAEVVFNNVHRSAVYPGGVGLRFARIVRFREDKPVAEVDTLQFLRALHAREATLAHRHLG